MTAFINQNDNIVNQSKSLNIRMIVLLLTV